MPKKEIENEKKWESLNIFQLFPQDLWDGKLYLPIHEWLISTFGQIIATSQDLTPKGSEGRELPLFRVLYLGQIHGSYINGCFWFP